MGIGVVGEIPLAKAIAAAVPVRNIVWDRTVGSHTPLHSQAHIPSSRNEAGMISVGAASPWSSS